MLEERLNVLENEDYKIKTESEIKEEKVKVNKEKIKSISRDKGVDEKTISKIIQLIENCESAKYSRSSNSIMNNDLNNAREVINLILKNKQ